MFAIVDTGLLIAFFDRAERHNRWIAKRIVPMAEIYRRHAIVTLDPDFSVYRKHGRVPLLLVHPSAS
jgi:hypothetical protein